MVLTGGPAGGLVVSASGGGEVSKISPYLLINPLL